MQPDTLFEEFLSSDFFYSYEHYLEDEEGLLASLYAFVEGSAQAGKLPQVLTDIDGLTVFYLSFMPSDALVLPHEVIYVHEHLLDFYQFLYHRKYIAKNSYSKILNFFQENKQLYLERMVDESCWSILKKRELQDALAFEDDIAGKLLDALQKMPFTQSNGSKQTNNILPFPKKKQTNNVCQLRIDLDGFRPPVWRRVLVPEAFTLSELHNVIQILFDWDNAHLHEFHTDYQSFEPAVQIEEDTFWGSDSLKTEDVTLQSIFDETKKLKYTYDFGDDWVHTIKLEKVFTPEEAAAISPTLPICLKGKQDTPEEDSRFDERYIPFDIDKINRELAKMK